VSRDILVQIAALPTTAAIWKHLETSFASQSRARVINTHMALATTQKGSSSMAEYVLKMKTMGNEMALTRKKLDDEELISYILAGLDYEYNSLVSSIAARVEPVTLGDMYSQLLAFETRLELQNGA
jgi:glutathionylspermidine synthase